MPHICMLCAPGNTISPTTEAVPSAQWCALNKHGVCVVNGIAEGSPGMILKWKAKTVRVLVKGVAHDCTYTPQQG